MNTYPTLLVFPSDIVLIAQSPQELQEMLSYIHNFSRPVGLNMHLGKTRMMLNNHTNVATVTANGAIIDGGR